MGISGAPEGIGFLSGNCPNQFPVEALPGREIEAEESVAGGDRARRGCDQGESPACGNLVNVQENDFQAKAEVDQGFESVSRAERARKKTARNLAESAARQIELREVYPTSWAWRNPLETRDFHDC